MSRGIVLQIAIHGDDDVAGSKIESGGERRGLAIVSFEAEDGDAGVFVGNCRQDLRSGVRALVVHIDELDRLVAPGHHFAEALVELAHALLLVVKWHDDREPRRHGVLG